MTTVIVKSKGCDLYPLGSIWDGEHDEKGFKIAGLNASWIPPNFMLENNQGVISMKMCPECTLIFKKDHPFVDTQQIGEEPMCIRCYEKKYIVGRESYRKALLEEIRQGYSHE